MRCLAVSGAARRRGAARPGVMRLLTVLAMLFAFGAGGLAVAQEKPGDDGPQVFDFEEDEISTDYLKPNTMMVEGLRRGRMSSLISVRLHFVDEIVKSAEDI